MDPVTGDYKTLSEEEVYQLALETYFDHTERLSRGVRTDDPRAAIVELEDSIHLGSQGKGLLRYDAAWLVEWGIILAYGLWRIDAKEEAADRLADACETLLDPDSRIESEEARELVERCKRLSRYPHFPHIDGLTDEDLPRYKYKRGTIWASDYEEDDEAEDETDVELESAEGDTEMKGSDIVRPEILVSRPPSEGSTVHSSMMRSFSTGEIVHELERGDLRYLDLDVPSRRRKAGSSPAYSSVGSHSPTRGNLSPFVAGHGAMPFTPDTTPRKRPTQKRRMLEPSPTNSVRAADDSSSSSSGIVSTMAFDENPFYTSATSTKECGFMMSATLATNEILKVVGSPIELGAWNPEKGLAFSLSGETRHMAMVRLDSLDLHDRFEWKLVKENTISHEYVWELHGKPNRVGRVDSNIPFLGAWIE